MWKAGFLLVSLLSSAVSLPEVTFNVLIAGYGPWGSTTLNPSAATAEALDATCQGLGGGRRVCFSGWNLTVDHSGASEVQRSLEMGQLQRVGIDAVITLGLESKAKGLRIELAGANVLAESNETAAIDPTRPLGALSPPTIDTSRLDIKTALEPIAKRANTQDPIMDPVDSLWSRDAGTFYCNEALYRTASTIRRLSVTHPRDPSLLLPFAFVHLPSPDVVPVDIVAPAIADLAKAMLVDIDSSK